MNSVAHSLLIHILENLLYEKNTTMNAISIYFSAAQCGRLMENVVVIVIL